MEGVFYWSGIEEHRGSKFRVYPEVGTGEGRGGVRET